MSSSPRDTDAPAQRSEAAELYRAAERGDSKGVDAAIARLSVSESETDQRWAGALSSLRANIAPDLASPSELPAPSETTGASSALPTTLWTGERVRRALLAGRLDIATDVSRRLMVEAESDPEAHLRGRLWAAWVRIETQQLEAHSVAELETLFQQAQRHGWAAPCADALALKALALSHLEDHDEAQRTARVASRLTRTEALPQSEYLANLTLARCRRMSGRPHLATRILHALLTVVPPVWRGRIQLELAFCGAAPEISEPATTPVERAAQAAFAAIRAACRGDRDAVSRCWSEAEDALAAAPSLRVELRRMRSAMDPDRAAADPVLRAWATGAEERPPGAVVGLCSVEELGAHRGGFVVAQPGHPAVRVVGLGVPTLGVPTQLARSQGVGRTETCIAALSLAGTAGLTREALFRLVFGFSFVPVRHDGVLRVALHRARTASKDLGVIEDRDDRLVLVPSRPFVVPDPRCENPTEERLLRFLSRRGRETAQDAAKRLGISLRKAQLALKQLADDGAVVIERKGRHVSYLLDDTTFQEPTRA